MARKQKTNALPHVDEYAYRVHYSPEDECYIGEADEFPGLSAFGDTLEVALQEIKTVVATGIELLQERKQVVPLPLSRLQFSGKLQLEIPPKLHRALALEATRRKMPLDKLIQSKLAHA